MGDVVRNSRVGTQKHIGAKRIDILIYILFHLELGCLKVEKIVIKTSFWHWNHYNIYWIVI